MGIFLRHPVQTLLLVMGATAITGALGVTRHGLDVLGLALGALGIAILVGVGELMLHTAELWGTPEELGIVTTDGRARMNFLLAAIGMLTVGVTIIWYGFGAGLIAGVPLVGSGLIILLCGVLSLFGWVNVRRRFG